MVYFILTLLVLLACALSYAVWFRFHAEAVAIKHVMALTDREKYYVKLTLENHRIENSELVKEDEELVNGLVERNWLVPFSDGSIVRGELTEYMAQRLK